MQNYFSRKIYSSEGTSEILVSSDRCRYAVWIEPDSITIRGPGVNEKTEGEEHPAFDSVEDLAIYLILLFESGLWPGD